MTGAWDKLTESLNGTVHNVKWLMHHAVKSSWHLE